MLFRNAASRLHEQLLHQVSGVPPMPSRRPHQREPALPVPVRHRPFGQLEEQRDLARSQQPAGEYLGRRISPEELGNKMLPL